MLRTILVFVVYLACSAPALAEPVKIVVLGDSLTAGYGLPPGGAFPDRLRDALAREGHDIDVVNAGVSGDTATGGLRRLDWAVDQDTTAVIVELGANDALRGVPPARTRQALSDIIAELHKRGIAVLLAGMRAPPNMGEAYVAEFDALYGQLASEHNVLLYPFFLEGVAGVGRLNQADGIHPTREGIDLIVEGILPSVHQLIDQARAKP